MQAETPGRTARDAKWRAEIRHLLDVPDKLPALHAKRWSTFSPMPGVLADRVTYTTADGMIVSAVVYRPDPKVTPYKGKLPGMVIVNGHGADKFTWYAFYSGLLFAKAGAVVVTYDPIGEGERNVRKASHENPSPHDAAPPDGISPAVWGPKLAGLMQVDLLQAVSYLRAQPEVDASRIGVAGYSMGAFISGIEGAYDTRVHAVVLSGGGVYGPPGGYFDSNRLPCQGPVYRALMPLGDRGAVLMALNADRGPMLVMNGLNDKVMDIPHQGPDWFDALKKRAVALNGSDKDMFATVFYPGVGHRTSWVDEDGVRWLNEQLHFAFWNTDAKIAAQGTTHISTWVRATGADIHPNYLVETREGGLDAVGHGFPAIKRADLMVLPQAEWEKLQDRLTYAAWVQRVLPDVRAMQAAKDKAEAARKPVH